VGTDLQIKKKRKSIRKQVLLCLVLYAFSFILAFFLSRPLFYSPYSSVLYDRKGQLLGALVAADGQWRFPSGASINEKFVTALIEYEDHRFYQHPGIDPFAIARAFWQNTTQRRIVSGGSTLTMQTIRLSRAPRYRTLQEKIIEMLLAFRLELGYSKKAILELYAAHAPFGANVVGIEAAAWRWFGRRQEDLSWADAAMLAVLPNSPALVHPGRNRETLMIKRNALLERLYRRGILDEETLVLSQLEEVPAQPSPLPHLAPHLLMRLSMNREHTGKISTTLDAFLQQRAQSIMNRWAERFSENGIDNAACLIMDTMTGAVRAYIGNVATIASPAVDLVTAQRSSGSLLKPFLYAAMLDSGDILPSSLVSDIPTRIGSYAPENNTQTYLGALPADQALAQSLNVPAVRSLRLYGVERFAQLLRSLGCTTLFRAGNDYGLPLILGGAEVTLWDMAGLYAGLTRAAFGMENPIFPPRVDTVDKEERGGRRIFSVGASWLSLQALSSVIRPGEEAAWQNYAGARQIAWKTGTSYGNRDAWSIGTTPEWTIAVWVGNASGEGRADLKSISKAAPILFELFSAVSDSAVPTWLSDSNPDLAEIEVCAASGLPAGIDCAATKTAFKPLSAPIHKACHYCRTVTLNAAQDREIVPKAGEPVVQKKWFVLPPAEEWYFRKWNLDYKPLPPKESASTTNIPLTLSNPEEGSQVFIPVELDGKLGRIVFSAVHREPAAIIHWHLDEEYLGWTEVFHEMEARPPAGPHTLTIVDALGNSAARHFTVLSQASLF
jgi:penicillin-binding protein 1C